MSPGTQNALDRAGEAVRQLVEECRKGGPLYARGPRAVAQVSRTGKWLATSGADAMVPTGFEAPGDEAEGVTTAVVKALIFVIEPAVVTMFLNIQK